MARPRTTAAARTGPGSASTSSTMTTRAPGAESLTCATVPTVSYNREYDIISEIITKLFPGNTFKPENVVNNAVEKFGIPNCGTNQVTGKN